MDEYEKDYLISKYCSYFDEYLDSGYFHGDKDGASAAAIILTIIDYLKEDKQ